MVSATEQLLITEGSLASREKYNSDDGGNSYYFQFCIWKTLLLVNSSR